MSNADPNRVCPPDNASSNVFRFEQPSSSSRQLAGTDELTSAPRPNSRAASNDPTLAVTVTTADQLPSTSSTSDGYTTLIASAQEINSTANAAIDGLSEAPESAHQPIRRGGVPEKEASALVSSNGSRHQKLDMLELPATSSSTSAFPMSQTIFLPDEDRELVIRFYSRSTLRLVLWYIACALSVGILYLVGRWAPRLWIRWNCSPADLSNTKGKHIIATVKTAYEGIEIVPLHTHALPEPVSTDFLFPATMSLPFASSAAAAANQRPSLQDSALEKHSTTSDEKANGSSIMSITSLRVLEYRTMPFVVYEPLGRLVLLSEWRDAAWTSVSSVSNGLSTSEAKQRQAVFGPNVVDVKGASTLSILITEATHPFYIFTLLSIALWSYDDYAVYAGVIAGVSVLGIAATTITTKQSANRLRKMSRFVCDVRVRRDRTWQHISSEDLVPGDVIDASGGEGLKDPLSTLPCDCVLLNGDAIVNEAMLTGESVPVVKSAASSAAMSQVLATGQDLRNMDKHCLSGGTKLIRVRIGDDAHVDDATGEAEHAARALVVKTGFNTAKGSLVRGMLFPKPVDNKFYRDAFRFIGILCIIAVIGFLGALIYFIKIGVDRVEIALRALDLFTICVPPALPAAMSVCVTFSIARLKRQSIYCTSPQRINLCGKTTCVVFDKTGTLTEEGLGVLGVRHAGKEQNFTPLRATADELRSEESPAGNADADATDPPSELRLSDALGCTHDLNVINGELIGEPLEITMLEWSGHVLEEASHKVELGGDGGGSAKTVDGSQASVQIVQGPDGTKRALVRKFEFVASLRRSSVIVKTAGSSNAVVYVKGAPEALQPIMDPASLPNDFQSVLDTITHTGYRVLALAGKTMPALRWDQSQRLTRRQAESHLQFLGLLVFENPLKPGSAAAIQTLRDAHIPVKMCTGDNALTAISCGREVGIVPTAAPVYMARLRDGAKGYSEGTEKGGVPSADEVGDAETDIEWVDVNDDTATLDPYSLDPRSGPLKLCDIALAVTGETFRHLLVHSAPETLHRLLVHGQIFARFGPEQKAELVERLHDLGETVAYVGDGANDCGALKTADVGLSLSEAEASVAAPFTSRSNDVGCIEYLIREGRAVLVTSSSMFKIMGVYAICEYYSVLLLYGQATSFDNAEYLFIDIFIILPLAFGLANSAPSKKLARLPPAARLMSRRVVLSLLGQLVLLILGQSTVYLLLHRQEFYVPPELDPEDLQLQDQDNTAVFIIGNYAYLLAGAIWSLGPPHRKPVYYNIILLPALIVLWTLAIYFNWTTGGPLYNLFGFFELSLNFQGVIFGVMLIQVALGVIYEFVILERLARSLEKPVQALRRYRAGEKSGEVVIEKPYKKVLKSVYGTDRPYHRKDATVRALAG